ncbi:MAG: potassium channel family protein [bacterium]
MSEAGHTQFTLSTPLTPSRRMGYTVGFLLALLVAGSFGYVYFEGWRFGEALYMTIITLSTVGFQEVRPLSEAGRAFTLVLIVVGFGTVGYALGNLSAFFLEGQLKELVRARKMEKILQTIKDHIIICGYGSEGRHAAEELRRSGAAVVIIERAPALVEKLQNEGKLVVLGDATDDDVLLKAGVTKAKALIAAVHEDSQNVFVTLTARGFNPNLILVAKAADEATVAKLLRAGATKVISSAEIGGRRMASVLLRPKVVNFLDVVTGNQELALRLEEIDISAGSSFIGKSIRDLHIRGRAGTLVIAYHREGQPIRINPSADTVVESGDVLIVLGNDSQVRTLREILQNVDHD